MGQIRNTAKILLFCFVLQGSAVRSLRVAPDAATGSASPAGSGWISLIYFSKKKCFYSGAAPLLGLTGVAPKRDLLKSSNL